MAGLSSKLKIAFLDRDGTLIFEPPDTRQIDLVEKVRMLPGVVEGLKRLKEEGYRLVMISNQDGRGTSSFPEADFQRPQKQFLELLKKEGIEFYRILICPHFAEDDCDCRKPRTGLVQDFLRQEKISVDRSIMIGDREADMEFAKNVGVWGVRMQTNGSFPRLANVERKTEETDVFIQCNLDGTGDFQIETGLKFFNHMLEQLSKHSLIDLRIRAKADSNVDEHHWVEDVGLTLGQSISRALGPRKGISRYGFLLPMDDTLAEVALDLGGRPYLAFNCEFTRERNSI